MPKISLETKINAPIERVFDLCRSVQVHVISTAHTHEQAVGGLTSGLLGLNDTVTWEATHLGVRQQLTSRITVCNSPYFFQDRMVRGAFQSFTHNHYFRTENQITVVDDQFDYESPFGLIGVAFNQLVLTDYMRSFLRRRLDIVKHIAESDEWHHYLSAQRYRWHWVETRSPLGDK